MAICLSEKRKKNMCVNKFIYNFSIKWHGTMKRMHSLWKTRDMQSFYKTTFVSGIPRRYFYAPVTIVRGH